MKLILDPGLAFGTGGHETTSLCMEALDERVTGGERVLEMAGRKRGYLVSGGEVNTERMAKVLLDEFRSGKLGNFTLEMPEDMV